MQVVPVPQGFLAFHAVRAGRGRVQPRGELWGSVLRSDATGKRYGP